tara:strand:- start:67 stop:1191 length:1125 start_codon:yes stop_codon:yes gene_type:complete
MSNKNHEQYLEQIETAVAETTQTLMRDNQSDFLKVARMVAEKQVEIDRLKEHQKNDRKTIRELRGHLKELAEEGVAEVTELKEKLEKHNTWAISTLQATGKWSVEEAEEQGLCPFNTITGRLVNTTHELKTAKSILSTNLEGRIEAYETMTNVKRDVIVRHADPTNDEYYTYKTCDEYEEELGELEEWKAIHPEWAPSGDLTPNFISECLDDQYENIKELKKEKEELEEERPEGGWDGKFAKDACEYRRMADSYDNLSLACQLNREEVEKLKGERENASYQLAGELEDINTRWAEDKEADRIVIEKLKAEMNRVFQAVYSYDGDYDGKIDELEDKAKKDREITTQIAIKLEAADAVLDGEGWGWDEEKQDYIED